MGKFLQVRVHVSTYRPEEAEKAFPRLYTVAWPLRRLGSDVPAGIVELVGQLVDQKNFGDHPKDIVDILEEGLKPVVAARDGLEQALADWKPAEANTFVDALEEGLVNLEKSMPKM